MAAFAMFKVGPLCPPSVPVAATPDPVTLEAVTAETVCESGSLSASGLTQAELDAGLLSAAAENDLPGACEYLRRGADVDARESGRYHKRTALMIAANDGFLDLAKLLHANGADVNLHGGSHDGGLYGRGWSALHYSAVAGNVEIARWLLDAGAELESTWDGVKTALWEASYWGRPGVVELLLSRGADVSRSPGDLSGIRAAVRETTVNYPYTRTMLSYYYPKPSADSLLLVVSLLAAGGAELNERRRGGRSILDEAVNRNNARVAKVLRQFGGKCFLATGPLCGVAEVVTAETVCESGSLSANGQTQAQLDAGLISAAKANDLPGACEYLRRGADMEAREVSQRFRRTALMIAAGEGFLELAKLLHGNGADVDRQAGNHRGGHNDSPGWTALHYAATAGHADMVSWLLDSGADMDARWGWGGIPGKSVLWEAAHWGRADVVELLLSRGADPEGGGSPLPLHGALWKLFGGGSAPWDFVMVGYSREELDSDSYVAVVSLLASRVPDVNRRVNGKSALDVAVHENQSRLAAVLRGFGGKCFVQTGPLCGVVPVATPDPVTLEAVTAETVCESGSLSANGQTQAQLNAGLISAAKANNLANACEYLRRGASPDSRESRGVFNRTALMIAASDGRLDLAKLLHGNGADVNQQKGQMNHWAYASPGWSALIYAATAGHADMVSWLLDSGADIEAYWHSPGKKTALWEAAFWGRADVVEILLSRGGNPDRSDASDAFPLHGGASKNGWGGASTPSNVVMFGYSRMGAGDAVKVVSLLAAAVSDVNALENGRTALDVAASQNRPEVAAVLRNAGGECLVETGPLCPIVEVATAETVTVTAETVCESGSLSANGLTQAWLDAKLVSAAKANNLAGVCEYLRRGASPDSRESRGVFNRTALMIAASDGRLDLAKLLHGNGADVNQQKGQMNHWAYASPGWSALIYAATAGHADLVSWLLDSGADIEAYWHSPGKKTALWEAAFWGRADVVEILLSRGGNPDRSDASDAFPLHGGASKNGWGGASTPSNVVMFGYSRMGAGDAVNVVSLLAAAVSDVNALENGRTALDVAASQNRPEVAAVLRNAGGECLVETGPLCPVVEVVTAETVTVTAETVCESGSLSANGQTQAQLDAGLISAAKANNLANACEYLRRGASPDSRESRGVFNRTALMIAASDGRLDLAKLLHANGADVNQQKGQMNHWAYASPGWSALIYAATAGHADLVSWLLDSGADIEAYWHSPGKKTALWEAAHWGRADVIGILLSHGADPDRSDASDAFPLHGGAGKLWGGAATPSNVVMVGYSRMGEDEAVNVVSLLAAAVSDVNALENGKTALDLAASQNRPEVAAVLRNAGGKCVVETGPLCPVVEVVTAETVCESGSLSANGQTQAQLDAGLISAAKANDLAKVCEHLRRGADMNARDRFQAPDGLHRRTPLMLAAVDNRLTLAKLLVENGADVNYKSGGPDLERQDGAGWSALMYAAGAGQVETATYLLDQGAEIDMQWASGYSALHEAAIWGRWETAELLIERGANVNLRGYGLGETPLHGASWGSNRRHFTSTRPSSRVSWNKVITALLAGGADVNARGNDDLDALPSRLRFDRVGGESPLDTLVLHHNKSQRAAKLRDAGGYCYVQTSSLCAYPPVAEADSLECPAGTLPTNGLTTAELNMTLRMAARGGDATRVCEALKRGAEVNDNLDDSEFTPLQEAVSGGHLEAVKVLLANGAEVNKRKDGAGHSPLDLAARDGEAEIAALLRNANGRCFVETGPLCQSVPVATPDPVTVVNTVAATVASTVAATVANTVVAEVENTVASTVAAGSCPAGTLPTNGLTQAQLDYEFLGAVLENDLEGACEYLRQGANIEIREDEVGRPYNLSALMIAAGRGGYNYPDMTRLLLANGAKTDARDGSGWVTALHYAAASGHTETAALILDWGGDVNVLSSGGDPSLYQAAHWGRADMVQLLLSRGADPDIQANTGVTPLHGAASNVARSGSAAVVSLLLSYDADPNLRRSRSNPGLITRAGETGHSPLDDLVARGYGNYAEAARILRDAGGKCFVRTSSLCQNVPVATPDPVTVVNTVAATVVATVANTVIAAVENTVASTVAAGSCPAGTLDANGLTQAQLDDGFLGAALENDVEEVCEYLRRGANIEIRTDQVGRPHHNTALVIAGRNNYLDLARLLLSNGADVDSTGGIAGGWSALYVAAYEGHADVARVFLDAGANPDVGLEHVPSWTPLHEAAYYNNWRIMKVLLTSGANPNIQTTRSGWRGGAPLHYVFDGTRSGSALAVSVLVAGDADVNLRDNRGRSALDLAANRGDAASAEILRAAGGQCFVSTRSLCEVVPVATPDPVTVVNTVAATVVATVANTVVAEVENTVASTVAAGSCPAGTLDANGMTQAQLDQAMLDAVDDGDLEEVCEYLRRGADANAYSTGRDAGLVALVYVRGNMEMAKLLLANGANPNQQHAGVSWTPIFWGGALSLEVVRLYLSHGADPNFSVGDDWNPLHEAAYYNRSELLRVLLTSGANPNIQTTRSGWRGGAPLHYVFDGTRSGSALAVSVLVAGDADVNLRDSGGNSALDLAARGGDAASAEILRAAGGQCFVSTSSLCGSAPAPAAAAAESAPAADRLRESFAGAFNPSPAFGDAFGAASGSSERFLSRLDSLMRSTSGSGGNAWDSFAGWQRENEHGRMWFSTGQRGDFGFGAGVGGAGGDLSASPFAAMVGNGMLAGGETGLGAAGKLRIAAFADYQARSLLDGTDRQWTKWAASGTAIETAMTEAERFSGLAENQTRGAMTEIHLGGGDLGVALQAGAVSESDAMLSGTADDENLRGLRARTAFAGLSGAADLFGSGWRLRGSAHLGRSWAESERMLRDGDLWASAFSAGLERGGWLYSDDGFILRFSQPLRVESLEMDLIGADGASRLGADPSGRQLDVDAAYRLPLSGGGWLLLSAGVRRDGGHTSSSDLEAGALFSVERGF